MTAPIAVLTGASSGIGAAVLHRLREAGYECLVVGLTEPAGAEFVRHDLSDPDDAALAAAAVRRRLDERGRAAALLVNNAGGARPVAAADLDAERVGRDVTLNLTAPMLLCAAVLPGMRAAGGGAIVNVASTAGRTGVAYLPTYSAAKAGLIAYTQSLAAECAGAGIHANCVCPGAVDTGSAREGRSELSRRHGLDPGAYQQGMAGRTGLGRLLTAAEVADVVLWLGTAAGRAVNGQAVNVCGTLTME
ncbi:SDR family oxidoreductase [Dactylosporangium sp. NPDC051485]|uniref:SDR family NAD(P)-dependent oxidoreductase n=1 Tax=Dactylosporangium sp. NPDC051485 TaxID=3154846 RepID=UPI00341C8A99